MDGGVTDDGFSVVVETVLGEATCPVVGIPTRDTDTEKYTPWLFCNDAECMSATTIMLCTPYN